MPATAAWLASAEAMFNRGIDASAQAAALAQRLEGTALQIDVEAFARIRTSVHHGRLVLLAGDDSAASATISGSPSALLQLLRGGAERKPGKPRAEIRGDAEVANLYRELFTLARPDAEEELSRWIGDFAARRVAGFARQALAFAARVRRTAGDNIAEYLQEEGRDLVNKTEHEEFLRGVDQLRETADRIEARLGRIEARLKGAA
jgi:ubiquinone biosynthesis accessory factor UbiJ